MRVSLLCLVLCIAAAQREEVPFSYAWRFFYGSGGDDAGPGPGSGWAFSPTAGAGCAAEYPDPHRITASDCATACAYDSACLSWRSSAFTGGRSCWHSGDASCGAPSPNNASTTGGARRAPTPLQTAYSFAAAALPEDAGWPIVDAPHDALMSLNGSFSETGGDAGHGYRVRTVAWYRKHFQLPADWAAGGPVFLRFEGVMHFAQVWLNGVYLASNGGASYNAFTVRLDNSSDAIFGGANVIAVRADASYGSEHWYGGGGLIRAVWLVRTATPAAIVEGGLFVPPELPPGSREARVSCEWGNAGAAAVAAAVRFDLLDEDSGALLASNSTAASALAPGAATRTAEAALI